MKQVLLELTEVTKRIRSRTLVNQLSLKVEAGEVFGFLGPNGAGKTTTIRMIVGLIQPSSGKIRIDGLDNRTHFEEALSRIGAIVENPEMYKYLSGYRNLIHFARMHPGVTKERIEEVVRLVGLKERIHHKVKTYSLGMRQRLGVAQALLHRPKVLILDEPTNGLDPAGIRELRDYLRHLARTEGLAVIVSSHLLSEMELMCDRVAIIDKGELIDVRSVKDLTAISPNAKRKVRLELETPDSALELLQEHWEKAHFQVTGTNKLEGELARTEIPLVLKELLLAGVQVYGVAGADKSLEEQFLELTGGVSIA